MRYTKSASDESLYVLERDFFTNISYNSDDESPSWLELHYETKLLAVGQAGTMGMVSMTWLPDHSCESAEMALLGAPGAGEAARRLGSLRGQ